MPNQAAKPYSSKGLWFFGSQHDLQSDEQEKRSVGRHGILDSSAIVTISQYFENLPKILFKLQKKQLKYFYVVSLVFKNYLPRK